MPHLFLSRNGRKHASLFFHCTNQVHISAVRLQVGQLHDKEKVLRSAETNCT